MCQTEDGGECGLRGEEEPLASLPPAVGVVAPVRNWPSPLSILRYLKNAIAYAHSWQDSSSPYVTGSLTRGVLDSTSLKGI